MILIMMIFLSSVLDSLSYVVQVLDDIDVPEELKGMFVSIPAEQFRMDISSTELRNRSGM